MNRASAILVSLFLIAPVFGEDGLLHQWQFDTAHVKGKTIAPLAGMLDASIVGPVQFDKGEPKALLLDGNSKQKHRISVTDDLKNAGLPARTISVESWARVDQTLEWGGIAGAVQDNGPYKKGWILGYKQNRFFFAVASKGKPTLDYLQARTSFQTGFWYHVLGTYDGQEHRLYVDGQLQAASKEQSGDIDYPANAFYTLGAFRDDNELYSMKGSLESVSVFGKALSSEQVESRFKERKSRFPEIDPVRMTVTDWPTQQRDNLRSGISTETLEFPMRLAWVHKARQAPRAAWPEEAKHDYFNNKYNMEERVVFDRAFHVVGVGRLICFASSSENKLTCLDADTGRVVWSFHAEGPMRLAPTIASERVLAGSDDGFVYCLRARDGVLLWKQRIGPDGRRIPGNERIISLWPIRTDVLVDDGKCHVCAGVFPSQGVYQATLALEDGKILDNRKLGVTAQGYLERRNGELHVTTGRDPAGAFVTKLKRLGKEIGKEVSSLPAEYPHAFIGAAGIRIGGGAGKIAAFRTADGSLIWSAAVEGRVFSLALVRGRLLASTDAGHVYCFVPGKGEPSSIEPPAPVEPVYPDVATKKRYAETAVWIAQQTKTPRGYCMILGSAEGWLACEVAKRTQWQIVGVEPDAERAERSRRLIDRAGLAHRVAIHQGSVDALPYTDCLFNVIASDSLAGTGRFTGSRPEALRVLRPSGGVAVFGMTTKDIERRGALEGAGEWTHLYGNPANTTCSGDRLVRDELRMQWFGPPGPRSMIDRHHRAASPLYRDGLLFIPGEDRVLGLDAYNGTILWDREVPDSRRVTVFRDSSQLAAGDDALYVASADRCLALDTLIGKTLRTYVVPTRMGEKLEWGFTARVGEFLVGSGVKPGSIRRTQSHKQTVTDTHWDFAPAVGSDVLFAYKCGTEQVAWSYRPPSGLILNQTLTIGNDRVYFIESGNPETLKKPIARAKLEELLGQESKLTALDLKTGKVLWSKSGVVLSLLEHNVFISYAKECLAVVGSRNSGLDKKTATLLYDVHVFDASTGERKWSKTQDQKQQIGGDHGEQERHPVIVEDKLYCEPMAYNLMTGERIEWNWPWTAKARRGCGTLAASASCFYFRDDNVTLFDLANSKPRKLTAETRPGCWINVIPAGGLLLAPESSSGCSCNFSVQTSLALIPVKR